MLSVSWVFPMFNEREYLQAAVSKARDALERITADYEILVVDDASNDGSTEILARLAEADKRIKPLRHERNRKLGGSLKTGFMSANKDIVVYSDIDMPFDFNEVQRAVLLLKEYDIVVGRRMGARESVLRRVYSFVYNILIRAVFNISLSDINFSMKVFRRDILRLINLRSEGSFINAELLVKSLRLGYRVKEIGVEYFPRRYGFSRLASLRVIAKIIYEMLIFAPGMLCFSRDKATLGFIFRLYRQAGVAARLHILARFWSCPFSALRSMLPAQGRFLDLGCGWGFFSYVINYDQPERSVTGVDWEERKIKTASGVLSPGMDVSFIASDIGSFVSSLKQGEFDFILLLDVLYLLPYARQWEILENCFRILPSGGGLLLKEEDNFPRWKYLFNFFQETVSLKVAGITRGQGLYFRGGDEYRGLLEKIGFKTEYFRLDKGRIHPHVAVLCRKP